MSFQLSTIALHKVARSMQNASAFAYPTEAVYGLGCLPDDASAVENLLKLKDRCVSKGLIVVAADLEQLGDWILPDDGIDWDQVRSSWPGHVTWILPTTFKAPSWVTGGRSSLAVRVSAHPLVQQLCKHFGPLISTSANPAGKPPATRRLQVHKYFKSEVYCTPGVLLGAGKPSQIRDARTLSTLRS